MDKLDMCLSLFKIFTNYLEIYKLNTDCEKKKEQPITCPINQTDPLSSINIETNENSLLINPSTSISANKNRKSESCKQFKGLKRKYLEESYENIERKILIRNNETQAILETDDGIGGVTQDELLKRNVIKKKENKSKKVVRRWWVREEYTQRDKSGYFVSTYLKMRKENNSEFFELTRTELPIYELLLDLLREDLTKRSIRTPIDYECRLAVTLIYLSQSTPFFQLATTFQIGKSTIREMILDTCDVIWKVLSPEYIKHLNENDYENIADDFLQKFGIPNCIGAFDSKVLNIMMPSRRSPKYVTNLKYMSLDITCDTNYLITWADIHPYNEEDNLEIFDNEFTDMPSEKPLPNSNLIFPHYFIGDTSFPLKEHIMRPYGNRNLDDPKKIVFNHYMSTAHNIIENTYGILASRWTILQTEFKCYPENLKKIVLAIIVLHNFIIKNSNIDGVQNKYCPNGFIDWIDDDGNEHEGEWRKYVKKLRHGNQGKYGSNNASRNALLLRDHLSDYLYANENSFQIVNL